MEWNLADVIELSWGQIRSLSLSHKRVEELREKERQQRPDSMYPGKKLVTVNGVKPDLKKSDGGPEYQDALAKKIASVKKKDGKISLTDLYKAVK